MKIPTIQGNEKILFWREVIKQLTESLCLEILREEPFLMKTFS